MGETARAMTTGEWLAVGAYILMGQLSLGLCVAVVSAMLDAVCPGWDTQTWVTVQTWLSVAPRAFCLVAVALAVTYLHTYRGTRGTGRRFPGWGRCRQYLGYAARHRVD